MARQTPKRHRVALTQRHATTRHNGTTTGWKRDGKHKGQLEWDQKRAGAGRTRCAHLLLFFLSKISLKFTIFTNSIPMSPCQACKTRPFGRVLAVRRPGPPSRHIEHAPWRVLRVWGNSIPMAPCRACKTRPFGRVSTVRQPGPPSRHVEHAPWRVLHVRGQLPPVRGTPYASDSRPSSASTSDSCLPSTSAPATSSLFRNAFSQMTSYATRSRPPSAPDRMMSRDVA